MGEGEPDDSPHPSPKPNLNPNPSHSPSPSPSPWGKDEIDIAPQLLSADDVKQARRSSFGNAVEHTFQEGDHVRITKTNSTVRNDLAVVKEPNWNIGLIKVELLEGKDKGKTKSYKPSDMVLVTSLGAAAALKPLEISLTGDLEEVGSQRQLLTDDDFFQVDCGGSSGGARPEGWLW